MSFYFVKRHFFNMKIGILVWSVSASVVPSIAEFQMGGIGLSSTFLSFYFYLFYFIFLSLWICFLLSRNCYLVCNVSAAARTARNLEPGKPLNRGKVHYRLSIVNQLFN